MLAVLVVLEVAVASVVVDNETTQQGKNKEISPEGMRRGGREMMLIG